MDVLLRWGLENSGSNSQPMDPANRQPLDPAIIDAILGKPDSEIMKENLSVAVDTQKSVKDRVTALDNFEMLIESIDNALNLTPLNMWQTLIELTKSNEDEIRQYAFWILGTSIQNNPSAQQAFLRYDPLPDIVSVFASSEHAPLNSTQTQAKAIYCLSNAMRHNASAVRRFDGLNGWAVLRNLLEDSDILIRRKTVYLIFTLLLQDGQPSPTQENAILPSGIATTHASRLPAPESPPTATSGLVSQALSKNTILQAILAPIPYGPNGDAEPDVDFAETAARACLAYVRLGVTPLKDDERLLLRKALDRADDARLGLDPDEWAVLDKAAAIK